MSISDWFSLAAILVSILSALIAYRANSIVKNQNVSGQWIATEDDMKPFIYVKNISPVRMTNVNIAVTVYEKVENGYPRLGNSDSDYKKMGVVKQCGPGETITFRFDEDNLPSSIKNGFPSMAFISIVSKGKSGVHYLSEIRLDVSFVNWWK
jgi:hypothetical protein